MVTPNELRALQRVMDAGIATKRKISGKMGINSDYAGYLLESLSKKDFLSLISRDKFDITPEGAALLLSQLHQTKTILEIKASQTVRKIETTEKKITDCENHMLKKSLEKYRSR